MCAPCSHLPSNISSIPKYLKRRMQFFILISLGDPANMYNITNEFILDRFLKRKLKHNFIRLKIQQNIFFFYKNCQTLVKIIYNKAKLFIGAKQLTLRQTNLPKNLVNDPEDRQTRPRTWVVMIHQSYRNKTSTNNGFHIYTWFVNLNAMRPIQKPRKIFFLVAWPLRGRVGG